MAYIYTKVESAGNLFNLWHASYFIQYFYCPSLFSYIMIYQLGEVDNHVIRTLASKAGVLPFHYSYGKVLFLVEPDVELKKKNSDTLILSW